MGPSKFEKIKRYIGLVVLFLSPFSVLSSDFGTQGLITIPTARMSDDGSFKATVSSNKVTNMFNLTYQVLPRVETTFRYTIFDPQEKGYNSDYLKDRSYGIKLNLVKERRFFPELSVGIRDVLGTGAWSGEYLVGSKRFNRLDFSAGLGWGRFSERGGYKNPLNIFSQSFSDRGDYSGGKRGGEVAYKNFFRGPVGIFGGVDYQFPELPIRLMLQYNSDAYNREADKGGIFDPSPFSYGLAWDLPGGSSIALSHQQQEYVGINLSYEIDTKSPAKRKGPAPFYSSLSNNNLELKETERDLKTWYSRLLYDFERSGLKLLKANLETGSTHASLEIENLNYVLVADAINRALMLCELHLPERTKSVELHIVARGLRGPTIKYTLRSRQRTGQLDEYRSNTEGSERIVIRNPQSLVKANKKTKYQYLKLATGVDLGGKVLLFGPEKSLYHQLFAKFEARFIVNEHVNVWAGYDLDITNDFNNAYPSNSVLPHVRTDMNLYLTEGASGLNHFFAETRFSLNNSLHNRSYIGILEQMFSGVGSELLYHEYDKRWAVGASATWVRQRDYEKNFNHLDYNTVTGFLSFYYASPIANFDFAIHAGKYLAKDRGLTFEARRSFDNGFNIGAFFSKTNVSAEDFGEGSFDKGLYFEFPIDHFVKGNNRSAFSTILRSLNRDGGRRLEDFGQNLWFDRRSFRLDGLNRNLHRMTP